MKKKKITILASLVTICFVAAIFSKAPAEKYSGKIWAGVTYAMSQSGKHSNKSVAAVGVIGVFSSAAEGAVWGSVAGPAGTVAGIVSGL